LYVFACAFAHPPPRPIVCPISQHPALQRGQEQYQMCFSDLRELWFLSFC
jgi:hypothetical protein